MSLQLAVGRVNTPPAISKLRGVKFRKLTPVFLV